MYGHRRKEVAIPVIRLKDGHGRIVALHCLVYLWEASGTPLCHVHLLQEVTDAAVAVMAAYDTRLLQVGIRDGWHRSLEVQHLDAVMVDAHLYRIAVVPRLVKDTVCQYLFQGLIWIVVATHRLLVTKHFDDLLQQHLFTDIPQSRLQLQMDRPMQNLLREAVAHLVEEVDYLDACIRKVLFWILVILG